MNKKSIYIGQNKVNETADMVKIDQVQIENEVYYKISNSNAMRSFFMSIVSDSNHWMFISSNGALTAGRKDCDLALFPYYTDDKITESSEITGSKTILQIHSKEKTYLWEPFSERYNGVYDISRNLFKNIYGNKIIFEEINQTLGITFRYQWNSSNLFGFVKRSSLINNTNKSIDVTVVDGIQNVMPYGVSADLQNTRSNLVDAYKKSELDNETGIGVFALSAIIVDKAEPSEALKSSIAWSCGLKSPKYLVSSLQFDNFRRGEEIHQEREVKAEKGAYFVHADLSLLPKKDNSWMIVANVNQSIISIKNISEKLKVNNDVSQEVQIDINLGTQRLVELNAASDGLQMSADDLRNTRHFSNTLFNIMRGGTFDDNYQIGKSDFTKYIYNANKTVFEQKKNLLDKLPNQFSFAHLRSIAQIDENKDFKRLGMEYLPLKFSRRHGDPSRPWNKFSINTTSEIDGSKILDYEGNWRDIFQNWEALAHSYPEFIDSMIHKFLNASTFEGYNPYRVTKNGFDWEVIEPNDPWSYIGYWGDHQIIYLLKFLEFIEDHYPKRLSEYFDQDHFVFANVPYKIKSYNDILKNSKDTIDFDTSLDEQISKRKTILGADGSLLLDRNSNIYRVNLIEKLLVAVLAKISNFIPEAGIWMNTQRPEWNDANNALVGNGVSMVTLYYLRRFISFFHEIIDEMSAEKVKISEELAHFYNTVLKVLNEHATILSGKISDKDRKTILDGLGQAGSTYRTFIYDNGYSGQMDTISKSDLLQFFNISKEYIDHTIKANKGEKNLYHAYNLMTIENDSEISISYLPEMLEGQVAVLSSGFLSGEASLELLDALKNSALFRPDQYSYLLYPNKKLAGFYEKNNIPSQNVDSSKLLQQLVNDGNSQIIEQDVLGNYHFNGNFNNAESLKNAIDNLPKEKYQELIEKDTSLVLDLFEEIFDHKSFTGRSGTFFGYEGLGSIYWHMVSKLALAVQKTCLTAINKNESDKLIGGLIHHYFEINAGIGVHKSPKLYGAFPTDPYSHTPAGKGAQQPGMTGQVKEDILCRFGELGVSVSSGKLYFNPKLLTNSEFLKGKKTFKYVDVNKQSKVIHLEANSLCFTYCQIPIIYKRFNKHGLEIKCNNETIISKERNLNKELSSKVFQRTGEIERIVVLIDMQFNE
jgi:hypothetical protein